MGETIGTPWSWRRQNVMVCGWGEMRCKAVSGRGARRRQDAVRGSDNRNVGGTWGGSGDGCEIYFFHLRK
jgi:hypothetical protein